MKKLSLQDASSLVDGKLVSKNNNDITTLSSIDNATPDSICFFDDVKHKNALASTKAGCVILHEKHAEYFSGAKIIHHNPRFAFAKLSHFFENKVIISGVHPTAVIGENCSISADVAIAANVVLGNNVTIGSGVKVHAGSVIEDNVVLGENCEIKPNVTVMHSCIIGKNCILHSGSVIGGDGFGYAYNNNEYHKIAHLGKVVLGNDVEIGSSTTIDRGTIDDTVLEDGVKLDNQIQIGHNVKIGANTVVSGACAVAGSSVVGKKCQIGGMSGISGHIKIVDNVSITAASLVTKNITESGVYSSSLGVMPQMIWNKNYACLKKLYSFMKKVNMGEKNYE